MKLRALFASRYLGTTTLELAAELDRCGFLSSSTDFFLFQTHFMAS
jgi:hypothetical protein